MTSTSSADRIRDLNDAMRRTGPSSGRWVTTQGVYAKGLEFMILATSAVQSFAAFDPDNDPHGEHDFGAFDLAGFRLFWKIDLYEKGFVKRACSDPFVRRFRFLRCADWLRSF